MTRQNRFTTVHPGFRHLLAFSFLLAGGGCAIFQPRATNPTTQTDRLMKAYDDLAGGRFVVLADFEDPRHMELFQLISVSEQAKCVLDSRAGRKESGPAVLRCTAGSAEDTVVITDRSASSWHLTRDWRPYDLLLMSLSAPMDGLTAELSVAGGSDDSREVVHSSLPLHRGRNLVRLDLEELGERLPLDDIRELRLAFSGFEKPVTLLLDDLILVSNRRDIFGDSKNDEGALYVGQAGRRWQVGAGGRFELTFAYGQIVGWYDLGNDPFRLRNLVAGATLGPSPILVQDVVPPVGSPGMPGTAVSVYPRVLEANEVRVVLRTDWYTTDADESHSDDLLRRWTYTIYADGRMYVSVETPRSIAGESATSTGLAVFLTAAKGDAVQTHTSPRNQTDVAFATAHSETAGYSLLYALSGGHRLNTIRTRSRGGGQRITFAATRLDRAEARNSWRCLVWLAAIENYSSGELEQAAREYFEPQVLELQTGKIWRGADDTTTLHGFNQDQGCYELVAEEGQVRLTFDGSSNLAGRPTFRVRDSHDKDAWVYINHDLHTPLARTTEGDVLFRIPTTVTESVLVEILLRPAKGASQ